MARNDPQVNLRMSEALKKRLDESAAANNRSLTAEITSRLEDSYAVEKNGEDMLRLSLRLERDLYSSEVELSTMQMTLGLFGRKVEDLLNSLEKGTVLSKELISELRGDCEAAVQEGQEGYTKSEDFIRKMRDATAKHNAFALVNKGKSRVGK